MKAVKKQFVSSTTYGIIMSSFLKKKVRLKRLKKTYLTNSIFLISLKEIGAVGEEQTTAENQSLLKAVICKIIS